MHVQPISTFRLFQEGHLLRNSIAIFVLTSLFTQSELNAMCSTTL